MCQLGIEVPLLLGDPNASSITEADNHSISSLSEGFSPFWTLEGVTTTLPFPLLDHPSPKEGNWECSPHVIASHRHNPEVNTALPKLMSVLPGIPPYLPGWALPQQESGVTSRLPACDPHMPRRMRSNVNLLVDFPEQMRESMECYLCLFFFFPPFGSSNLEWTDRIKQKSKNCLCILSQAIIKMEAHLPS